MTRKWGPCSRCHEIIYIENDMFIDASWDAVKPSVVKHFKCDQPLKEAIESKKPETTIMKRATLLDFKKTPKERTLKIPFHKPSIGNDEIVAVNRVLNSGWLTTGPETALFEKEFAEFVGSKFAVAVNSCTAALHLALKVLNIRRGDLVLVPTFTFVATAEVVTYFGATPIFIDSDPRDFNIDPIEVKHTINKFGAKNIKAIIPVHVAGQIGSLEEILTLSVKYNIPIIEDSAHTLPAYWREFSNKPWFHAGTSGSIGCFSFYPNKPITTGEGGMVVTDNEEYAKRIRKLSLHGLDTNAWDRSNNNALVLTDIVEPGFKYNLTDIASAIGRVQLKRVKDLWEARKKIAQTYNEQLSDLLELELPVERINRLHSWCLYIAKLKAPKNRDLIVQRLREKGVYATVHWRPLHLQTYYSYRHYSEKDFPVATDLGNRVLSLPLYAGMTESEIDFVISMVKKVVREND